MSTAQLTDRLLPVRQPPEQVRTGDVIHLWNTYGDNGGFLETNGGGPGGGKYDVCTNAYYNRAQNVADWKLHRA
ncbi:hypothetical protein [Streptomyces sp. MCL20-2]|uniref:hypothetical protein n=1 Tax=Streptomyces sp. MCL20-2 TaxID=2967219 RepID=UPI002965EDB0|nr:hypothetical protein [Streptomyces sp. MCL20-2]